MNTNPEQNARICAILRTGADLLKDINADNPNAAHLNYAAARIEELEKEIAELKARCAAINGQRNVMANSVNGQLWEQYWTADKLMGELIGGDYDHELATKFAGLIAERDRLKDLIHSEDGYIASQDWLRAEVARLQKERDEARLDLQSLRDAIEIARHQP